jgi:hypothetical protein
MRLEKMVKHLVGQKLIQEIILTMRYREIKVKILILVNVYLQVASTLRILFINNLKIFQTFKLVTI